VLRIAQSDRAPLHLEKLGFAYDTFKQWRKLLSLPNGLILVTGPAGSGKRTTLYASLSEMNAAELNLCTVEQSVQTNLPGITQLEIDARGGFGFAESVSALLRHNPDVLMIGDVRDSATARLAAQAALDGRLILAAASAADTSAAIGWLLNLGAEPFLLGATLAGVLAQRLVRKLCTACKEPYEPTAGERRQLDRHVGSVETLYKPKGCPRCRNLGYLSRIGVHELLVPDDHFRERLSQAAPLSELRDLARAARFKTLRTDGMEKVKAGITTLAEVHRTTV
jgi:type II secretory ATPase GspE/PulE/Tfp pilus assembly ATPase PilB-like protein